MDETMETHDTSETMETSDTLNPNQQGATKPRGRQAKNNLKRERELLGWSRTYVAQKIGSDAQTIGRWERGTTSPSPFYRQALCELFRMNAAELGLLKDEVPEPVVAEKREELPLAEVRREELPVEEVSTIGEHTERERLGQPVFSAYRPYPQAPVAMNYPGLLGFIALGVTATLLCTLGFMLVAARVLPVSISFMATVQSDVKPGGLWVAPLNKQTVHGIIYFAAKAYPTNPGDPAINHVNFTIGWTNGGWRTGCTAYPPVVENLYTCTAVLTLFPAPLGNLRISFDVYDQLGNSNFAPNGIHTVVYAP